MFRGYFKKEPDWTDTHSVEDFLKKEKFPFYSMFNDRVRLARWRIRLEQNSAENVYLFSGDHLSERLIDPQTREKLWDKEFEALTRANKYGSDIKILARWDPSSAGLIYTLKSYVDEGIDVREYGGNIRGGIFDEYMMYSVGRHLAVPPSELSPQNIQKLPKKTIGVPQRDKDVPIEALNTTYPPLIKMFTEKLLEEYKKATPVKDHIEKQEKQAHEHESNGKHPQLL